MRGLFAAFSQHRQHLHENPDRLRPAPGQAPRLHARFARFLPGDRPRCTGPGRRHRRRHIGAAFHRARGADLAGHLRARQPRVRRPGKRAKSSTDRGGPWPPTCPACTTWRATPSRSAAPGSGERPGIRTCSDGAMQATSTGSMASLPISRLRPGDESPWTIGRHLEAHRLQTENLLAQPGFLEVVITHWPPVIGALPPQHRSHRLAGYWVNDREDLVREIRPQLVDQRQRAWPARCDGRRYPLCGQPRRRSGGWNRDGRI